MSAWIDALGADPRPWLLEPDDPAVRHATLVTLLGRDPRDGEVAEARAVAMTSDPIASFLRAQDPAGWWVKPGAGYGPKYSGTVWSLIFLDQLHADAADPRIQAVCTYVLAQTPTSSGGLGMSGSREERPPPPSSVAHCLNGNLLRALIGFGRLDDHRVQAAIEWQARAITGTEPITWYRSATSGPGFACGVNEGLPCGWGAAKAMLALARIPPARRSPEVANAIDEGVAFLLSRDPAVADYPMGWGNTRPNGSWFKLGFPSGYVADVLQVLEALAEVGHARDDRLAHAVEWLFAKAGPDGRWRNEYAYRGKTWIDIEQQGAPSKWVTLRASRFLQAALG